MRRLLLVDDDPEVRATFLAVLHHRMPDLTVDAAASAEAGSDMLARARYDAVVADLRLPGRDGLDLVAEARRVQPGAVCVLVTAFAAGLDAGDVPVVPKPVATEALVHMVEQALARPPAPDAVAAAAPPQP